MEMENRASTSILDLTLKARHLRSAYLANLVPRALQRVGKAAPRTDAPLTEADIAFERR